MDGQTVTSVTGSFGVTNPVCPIEIISLLSESTPFFQLDLLDNMQFVVTRHYDAAYGDPTYFTIFAQARGFSTDEFTFDDMFYVVMEPEVEEVVESVVQTETVYIAEPTVEEVRSTEEEDDGHNWSITILLVVLAFCTACCVSLLCLRLLRGPQQAESGYGMTYYAPPEQPQYVVQHQQSPRMLAIEAPRYVEQPQMMHSTGMSNVQYVRRQTNPEFVQGGHYVQAYPGQGPVYI